MVQDAVHPVKVFQVKSMKSDSTSGRSGEVTNLVCICIMVRQSPWSQKYEEGQRVG